MTLFHPRAAKGIDVSSNNHTSGQPWDWMKVRQAGIDFVYVKATQGTDYVNEYFLGDTRGAFDHSIKVGLYHFASTADPTKEAEWFFENGISQAVRENGDILSLHPILDYEQMAPDARWISVFIARLAELYTPECAQYMDRSYYSNIGNRGKFTWLAWPGWESKEGMPTGVAIIQYGQEPIDGIGSSLVDVNHVNDMREIEIASKAPEAPASTTAVPRSNEAPNSAAPDPKPEEKAPEVKSPLMVVNLFDDNTYTLAVRKAPEASA